MKQHIGVWLPDHEQHLIGWMDDNKQVIDGVGTYQYAKQDRCYKLLTERQSQFRVAIDVGAHVGLWTVHMAKRFRAVHSFEPVAEHIACFERNVYTGSAWAKKNVKLYRVALGNSMGYVRMVTEQGSSGNTHVIENPKMEDCVTPMFPLDSYYFMGVDFIKIDCEGFEYKVLQGAKDTIERYKPVIMVEQKHDFASKRYGIEDRAAVGLLESWGAKLQFEMSGDFCMAW